MWLHITSFGTQGTCAPPGQPETHFTTSTIIISKDTMFKNTHTAVHTAHTQFLHTSQSRPNCRHLYKYSCWWFNYRLTHRPEVQCLSHCPHRAPQLQPFTVNFIFNARLTSEGDAGGNEVILRAQFSTQIRYRFKTFRPEPPNKTKATMQLLVSQCMKCTYVHVDVICFAPLD